MNDSHNCRGQTRLPTSLKTPMEAKNVGFLGGTVRWPSLTRRFITVGSPRHAWPKPSRLQLIRSNSLPSAELSGSNISFASMCIGMKFPLTKAPGSQRPISRNHPRPRTHWTSIGNGNPKMAKPTSGIINSALGRIRTNHLQTKRTRQDRPEK